MDAPEDDICQVRFTVNYAGVNSVDFTLFRWEAARDWKDVNPKGSKQDFIKFWDTIQQDNSQLQVGFIPL
jgi:hypothetical protein